MMMLFERKDSEIDRHYYKNKYNLFIYVVKEYNVCMYICMTYTYLYNFKVGSLTLVVQQSFGSLNK